MAFWAYFLQGELPGKNSMHPLENSKLMATIWLGMDVEGAGRGRKPNPDKPEKLQVN